MCAKSAMVVVGPRRPARSALYLERRHVSTWAAAGSRGAAAAGRPRPDAGAAGPPRGAGAPGQPEAWRRYSPPARTAPSPPPSPRAMCRAARSRSGRAGHDGLLRDVVAELGAEASAPWGIGDKLILLVLNRRRRRHQRLSAVLGGRGLDPQLPHHVPIVLRDLAVGVRPRPQHGLQLRDLLLQLRQPEAFNLLRGRKRNVLGLPRVVLVAPAPQPASKPLPRQLRHHHHDAVDQIEGLLALRVPHGAARACDPAVEAESADDGRGAQ
mmetsp:Transcript_16405/g.46973  ORF Transcript_16405/g.46973 Transcript_16405/m.46973 type:complete len:268 (+) Transcript_16405:531-1334(+)